MIANGIEEVDAADLLIPQQIGHDRFRGEQCPADYRRTFGGLLAARALSAAAQTVDGRAGHALHLLFLRAGNPTLPMELTVDRLRDGRAFTSRSVKIFQGDRLLVTALASFHRTETGPEHEITMPEVAPPEALRDQRDIRNEKAVDRGLAAKRHIVEELLDIRSFDEPLDRSSGIEGRRFLWFRSRQTLPDDAAVHQATLAFASDIGLVHVGMAAHNHLGDGKPLDAASLDHTLWFHRPVKADSWLLYVQQSPIARGGRGLSRGVIFDQSGSLVASAAQEILIRHLTPREASRSVA